MRVFNHFGGNIKGYFLIAHYNDIAKANAHFNSIQKDSNRFLYDWNNDEHKKKFYLAASQPEGYKIYSTYFLPNYKDKITKPLKDKINRYMYQNAETRDRNSGKRISSILPTSFYRIKCNPL